MAVRAACFERVGKTLRYPDVPRIPFPPLDPYANVVSLCHDSEMRRIDARRVPTNVIQDIALRYCPVSQLIGDMSRLPFLVSDGDLSIAGCAEGSDPEPTPRHRLR